MMISVECPTCSFCGVAPVMLVDGIAYVTWKGGAYIQDAFVNMPR